MTLAFGFHPEARAEFTAAVDWYDARDVGLGGRFADAVRAAIDAAVEDPEAWPTWPGWEREPVVRSKGVSGFPYRVLFFADNNVVTWRWHTPSADPATGECEPALDPARTVRKKSGGDRLRPTTPDGSISA